MPDRYWLVHPNGGRQLIDPNQFDLDRLAEHARRIGGRLIVEGVVASPISPPMSDDIRDEGAPPRRFEPPISALGPLFNARLERIYRCLHEFEIDINTRPTTRVLGG